jgi:hypothetical protein
MFGTAQEPGLIPKCLHRIFLNVGQNIDEKVFFKPEGLENLIPTTDCRLDIEIAARNYIFKEDKNDQVSSIFLLLIHFLIDRIFSATNSFTEYCPRTK